MQELQYFYHIYVQCRGQIKIKQLFSCQRFSAFLFSSNARLLIISATYPLDPPAISVRSSVLSADETTGLAVFLQSAAQALIGQPMVQELMQKGLEWCVDNGISGDKDKSEQSDRKKGILKILYFNQLTSFLCYTL